MNGLTWKTLFEHEHDKKITVTLPEWVLHLAFGRLYLEMSLIEGQVIDMTAEQEERLKAYGEAVDAIYKAVEGEK